MSDTYRLYGKTIESEIPLRAERVDDPPSITLELGTETAAEERRVLATTDGPSTGYKIIETTDGHIVRFNLMFDFVVQGGRVEIVRTGDVPMEMAGVLFTGNVMSTLMTLEGRCVLHASAVAIDGKAIAFLGRPGMGKSTLAALLSAAGAEFVTDDVLVIDERDDGLHCVPSSTEIRLRAAASSLAEELQGDAKESVDGRTSVGVPSATQAPRLTALVFPRPTRESPNVEVTKVSHADALMELTRYPRLRGWQTKEILEQSFRWNARIAREVPCYTAVLPWGPPFDPSVARDLIALVT